ncbi:universal stress protein [Polaromonas sp. P1-6]|nr:universal stress protein [Polaromonas sp. P1-6]UUZ68323.1 universal stress protein [Polaromonas sp. P2-4]
MKILFAADGSKFTKKALAFLVTHESLAGPEDELVVLNVQPPVPPRVKTMVGAATVNAYHRDEANRVLEPIERFLKRHKLQFRTTWVVGIPATEVVRAAKREQAHMIVMGTHGHGLLGRAIMGSVAQRVVTDSEIPVLLVK